MIVVDTSVLLAAIDDDDHDHHRCAAVLSDHAGSLVVPAPAVAETSWMIEDCLGPAAESVFVASVAAGELVVVDLDQDDYRRCVELIDTYADMGLGLVDASLVTIAERLRVSTIATMNRSDFLVVRPRHCDAFELIP